MKTVFIILIFLSGFFLNPVHTHAQEEPREIDIEESAEVYLEAYSDEFQEKFFEALKQKGIENHDRAINLLLDCKRLDEENSVISHELAKAYFEDQQYISAQEYAVEAVLAEPENHWYLNTLVDILYKQGASFDKVSAVVPFDNTKLKENLALIYFKTEKYNEALALLKAMTSSSFTKALSVKITDSLKIQQEESQSFAFSAIEEGESDPFEDYKVRIEGFIRANNLGILEQLATEALESYPSQPFFYYALGYAINKTGKPKEAVEVLEAALDYMLDDIALSNKIYKELAEAYTALNNSSKANMYLRKIKPGF